MKNAKESKDLIRIDKNIAQNSVSFAQFDSDENLIRNLTIYFSVISQKSEDLFGFITFDPKSFAKDMGYKSLSFLFDVIDEPFQLKRVGAKEYKKLQETKPEEVFKTRMENALYKMLSNPMELKYRGQAYDGNDYVSLRAISLIEEITIIIDKHNKGKKYYRVKFSKLIRENLINFFSFMDLETYVQLPERLKNFYLMICNIKYNMLFNVSTNFNYSIDDLCLFLNVNDSEMRYRKKNINKAFQEIAKYDKKLGIELEWERNGKFAYKPSFKLSAVPPEIPDRKVIFEGIFNSEYLRECLEFFTQTFVNDKGIQQSEEHKKAFIAWVQDPKQNIKEKLNCFYNTSSRVYKEKFKKDEGKAIDYVVKFKY